MSNQAQTRRILAIEDASFRSEGTLPGPEFQKQVLGALGGLQGSLQELAEGQDKLFKGQSELTVAFGRLVPRIETLENEARWAGRAKTILKVMIPLVGGYLAQYVPGLAKAIPDILKSLE